MRQREHFLDTSSFSQLSVLQIESFHLSGAVVVHPWLPSQERKGIGYLEEVTTQYSIYWNLTSFLVYHSEQTFGWFRTMPQPDFGWPISDRADWTITCMFGTRNRRGWRKRWLKADIFTKTWLHQNLIEEDVIYFKQLLLTTSSPFHPSKPSLLSRLLSSIPAKGVHPALENFIAEGMVQHSSRSTSTYVLGCWCNPNIFIGLVCNLNTISYKN